MALKESEEEFKLPLRQWLMKKIETQQFHGLEWIDESQKLFKIPWTQKGHPNWEEDYQVFIVCPKRQSNILFSYILSKTRLLILSFF